MVHFLDNNFASLDQEFVLQRFVLMKDLQAAGYLNMWGPKSPVIFFCIMNTWIWLGIAVVSLCFAEWSRLVKKPCAILENITTTACPRSR